LTTDELARALALTESAFVRRLQTVGGFGGKSDQLNHYNVFLGDPGFFGRDLARYRRADAHRIREVAAARLQRAHCVTLSVVPAGHRQLAASDSVPVEVA
jgi:zinc protease